VYPNPQDVLPLPPRPDVEHYRKRAKDLVKACKSRDDAIQAWAARWVATVLELQPGASLKPAGRDAERLARAIAGFARERLTPADCALSQAQFVIARAHGFASWPALVQHIERLVLTGSEVSAFELAAEAIVDGDLATLERLLTQDPDLVRARSTRDHHATLLHYVSANGVENFRQRTPANIVAIARRLLEAGADLNAEAEVYGGGAQTLGLVVTSAHPRLAGVQDELADLLLDRGARMDAGIVRSCLANGCPEAAAHMAARGASVDLEEAAGIGRLDLVARHFETPEAVSQAEGAAALSMASWYDRRDVVAYLLDRGVEVGARAPRDGRTALHIAAYRGNSPLVELLLERGAPVNVTDAVHGTPPLAWALHGWLAERHEPADAYRDVLRKLADAGAEVKPQWIDDDRLRADVELYAALSRRVARA
jgi:ankyrin repeat protein